MKKIIINGIEIIKNIKKVLSLVFKISPFFTFWMGFSSILSGVLPIIMLLISKNLIDEVVNIIKNGITQKLVYSALIWVGLEFMASLINLSINHLNSYLYMKYSRKISNSIKISIYKKTITLDMSKFDNEAFYNKLTKAVNESGERPIKIIQTVFSEMQIIITLFGMISIFSMFSPLTLVVIITCTIPIIFAEIKYSNKLYAIYKKRINEKRLEGYWGFLLTDQTCIKEVLIFRLGNYLIKSIQEKMNKFLKEDKKFHKEKNLVQMALQTIAQISYYLYYGYFVFLAITLKITLGDLNMLISAIRKTQELLKLFLINISQLYESDLFIKDLFSFEQIVPEIRQDLDSGIQIKEINKIEFRNIFFKYPNEEKYVLNDLSFFIHYGQKVALVGRNGSGKSTIIKLLVRLYKPTLGKILINDIPIEECNILNIRKLIGVIFQDYLQYQVSVKENIAYGNIDFINDSQKILKASRKGKSESFINLLPNKFNTKLGKLYADNGSELSKGQWQRIALSRAFMNQNASIYILDEPTASLDIETEYEIYTNFQEMIEDKTCLLVSHRLSTIRSADRIIVLKNGRIVEDGDHNSLLSNGKEYSEIYQLNEKLYSIR